jgi:hypothetical protein
MLLFHRVSSSSLANGSVFEDECSDAFAQPFIQKHSVHMLCITDLKTSVEYNPPPNLHPCPNNCGKNRLLPWPTVWGNKSSSPFSLPEIHPFPPRPYNLREEHYLRLDPYTCVLLSLRNLPLENPSRTFRHPTPLLRAHPLTSRAHSCQ